MAIRRCQFKANICVALSFFLLLFSLSLLHSKLSSREEAEEKSLLIPIANTTSKDKLIALKFQKSTKDDAPRLEIETNKELDETHKSLKEIEGTHKKIEETNKEFEEIEGTHKKIEETNKEFEEIEETNKEFEGIEDTFKEIEEGGTREYDFDDRIDEFDNVDEDQEDELTPRRKRLGKKSRVIPKIGKNIDKNLDKNNQQNLEENQQNSDKIGQQNLDGSISNKDGEENDKRNPKELVHGIAKVYEKGNPRELSGFRSRDYEKGKVNDLGLKLQEKLNDYENSEKVRVRSGVLWDHLLGVARKPFFKRAARSRYAIEGQIYWGDESQNSEGNDAGKSKEAFSSDDEPVDESVRDKMEEVRGIEDALLLKTTERTSPLRNGWGPWFDTIQKRSGKSEFSKRDRVARATVDLLNPMNNPLLQDPDVVYPSGLTKTDRAIQKALKKASIDGVPFVGPFGKEEEEAKGEAEKAQALEKTLSDDSSLDGGDEASLKEKSNGEGDDGGVQVKRKALDNVDSKENEVVVEKAINGIKMLRGRSGLANSEKLGRKSVSEENENSVKNSFRDSAGFLSSELLAKPQLRRPGIGFRRGALRRLHSIGDSRYGKRKISSKQESQSKYKPQIGIVRGKIAARNSTESQNKALRAKTAKRSYRNWGYFPGIEPFIPFSEFMNEFFQNGNCSLRVFMAWTTPSWSYTVRHKRSLESLLYLHPHACVVLLSDSLEFDFLSDFAKDGHASVNWYKQAADTLDYIHASDALKLNFFHILVFCELAVFEQGYRVAVAMPNLDELLSNTPAHLFASLWLEWRKVDLYYIHYTELLRLAVLYKYGGVYIDSDVIVLKPLNSLSNTIGRDSLGTEDLCVNGAVMVFDQHSPFLLHCIEEYVATYDEKSLRGNGAELLSRVAKEFLKQSGAETLTIQQHWSFFPLSFHDALRYLKAPENQYDKEIQDMLFKKILEEAYTVHFWNSITSRFVPETGSIIERIINHHCIHCTDYL